MIVDETYGGSDRARARWARMCFAALLICLALILPLGLHAFADMHADYAPASEVGGVEALADDPDTEATDEDAEDEDDEDDEDEETPLTFDTPAVKPETVADVYGSGADVPGLRMEVFQTDALYYKFTLYGIGDLLSYMRAQLKDEDIDYSFRYDLRMIAERDFNLKGKLTFREPKRGEPERITWISTKLHYKSMEFKSKHPRVEQNKLSWYVGMQKWFRFDLDKISGFELTIYNAYDTRQKVIFQFDKDAVVTDTMLYTSLRKGGLLRVEVPDPSNITFTITDPKLRDGYKNSPDEPGAIDPFWHIKGIADATKWVEVILEGKDGQDIDHMDYYAGEYHRLPDNSNQYRAKSQAVTVKSYMIDGDKVVMYMMIPSGTGINAKYIQQVAVDMNNGTVLRNNIYNVY